MVPNGWDLVEAQDICQRISVGIVVKPKDYYVPEGEGVRAFRSANVREGYVEDSNWTYISNVGHQKNKKSILQAGDVLIVRTGYPGTACVVPEQYAGANCIDIIFARPDQTRVLPEYLCDFTNSEYGKRQVLDGQGGLAQQHFNVGSYNKLRVPLPPLAEQRKIADILSTWDRAIETTEALLGTARTQKRALMQTLLTGKRRFPEFKGEEWRSVKSSEVFETVSKKKNVNEPLLAVTQDQGVVRRDALERRVVMPDGSTDGYKLVVPGNFIISLRSFQGGLEYSAVRGLVSPAYHVLKPKTDIHDAFYKHYFKSYDFIGHLAVAIIGIRDGKQISYNDFSFLRIPAPSLKEQQKIGDALDVCEAEIDGLVEKVKKLRTEKKALMQQLLTGRRRVSV